MIFTYWNSKDLRPIAASVAHWRAVFPSFQVVGDEAVEAALASRFSEHFGLYRRLRLPSAKADVARLAMLHAHGGFYVDCHFGVTRPQDALRFVAEPKRPVVLLAREAGPAEAAGLRPLNGLIVSPAGHRWLARALERGLANLACRAAEEDAAAAGGPAPGPYDIFELVGARNLRAVLLADPFTVDEAFADEVQLVAEARAPFRRNVFKSYQRPGAHWSERQRVESLFLPPDGV